MDREILRHSCSHVMAAAVKELWPDVRVGIGPAIEDGFYYDFDRAEPFLPRDLELIESRMQEIIDRDLPFVREELSREEAVALFESRGEPYKVELIRGLAGGETVSVYKTGDSFVDLCRGPHIERTGRIGAFKLLSIAGAYWRGIETNPMLQRIYGTCFESRDELLAHLHNLEEAKKRDHRKLGPALDLFDIPQETAGAGLVFYHPKGALLRTLIEDYEKREHLKRGYQMVITPHIMSAGLWKTSGHYDFYRENMYVFDIDDKEFVLKPMNCPGHILIYQSRIRSYRELPFRLFELGTVYRHEKAGVLHGLLRVRGFTQDDAHIFCLPEQLRDEIRGAVAFVFETMKVFGFADLVIELSTRPEKSIGSDEDWTLATEALEGCLQEQGLAYETNEGEGAFYGPKIDIKLKDALKRSWQCATVQCDFSLPRRFDLAYVDAEGRKQRPVMLHRVLLGSIERFIGALIEHYNGELPLWLAPVQARIIPLKDELRAYAEEVRTALSAKGVRAELDSRHETLDKRIRFAELEKIPYTLVLGRREAAARSVSVRRKGSGNTGAVPVDEFIKQITQEIEDKNR